MRRRGAEEPVDFFARGRVVPGPDARVAAYLAVELGRAVVFPEPTEDAAERTNPSRFGASRKSALEETPVEVLDVRGAELVGTEIATRADEEAGGLKEMRAAR